MDNTLGIYIHIPFCSGKCAYCDFYSRAGCEEFINPYCDAVCRHIAEAGEQLSGFVIDSVFFGGGTPTQIGHEKLIKIFNTIKKTTRVLVNSEVTLEANPESVTRQGLVRLRRAGFNRLSLGVQSADDGILESIGRRHTFQQAVDAVKTARKAGFKNINLDLIYGLPSQTREGWADTLKKCIALKPDHISCYGLKIEPGTPLFLYRDSPFIPDDDMQADMYLYTVDLLKRNGFKQYEISNFAQDDKYSRHNFRYWSGGEYMGFGVAAHSYVAGMRYDTPSDIQEYIKAIENGRSVIEHVEKIGDFEKASEYLMLGLRTARGISEAEYQAIYPCPFQYISETLTEFMRMGLVSSKNDRWILTSQGFLLSNTIIGAVLDSQTRQRTAVATPWLTESLQRDPQLTLFSEEEGSIPLFRGI